MSNCPNYTTVPQKRQLHSLREKNIIIKRFEYRWGRVFDRKVLFLLFKRGKDFFFFFKIERTKKRRRKGDSWKRDEGHVTPIDSVNQPKFLEIEL